MDSNRVTVRYAKALLDFTREQNVLDQVYYDISIVYAAIDQVKNFSDFILSPGLNYKIKLERIYSTIGNKFHKITVDFLKLVLSKSREEYLKDICRNYIEMVKIEKGIKSATLKTAIPIEKNLKEQLKDKFEQKLNVKIDLNTEIEPEIMGGFIFTFDGIQYDASVASTLKSIKNQLEQY